MKCECGYETEMPMTHKDYVIGNVVGGVCRNQNLPPERWKGLEGNRTKADVVARQETDEEVTKALLEKYLGAGRTDLQFGDFLPEKGQVEQAEEVSEIFPIQNVRRDIIEWENLPFSEKYGELVKVMAEEAKHISFVVSGTTEGNSIGIMTKYERDCVGKFLKSRPDELSEAGLMSTPEVLGDLIAVFEEVKDRIEPRYTGAISTVEYCLSIYRQFEMHINAPSRTRS